MYRKIGCPLLIIHGDSDQIQLHARAKAVADITGAEFVTIAGSGHNPLGRIPAKINTLIVDFLDRKLDIPAPGKQTSRPASKARRALYLSSPIGLGHGRRDIAIARELRQLHPDLEIDWLAQDPVTRLLEANGERVHPLSTRLASESRHIEMESGEHDLHCFQAIRSMDEVLIANFMIFQDAVDAGGYDLVIADEAWDIDHYWHEHPELKKAALAWFTDFVGYVPMPSGGAHEAFLTTDYNAEMIEHIERHPGVRDRAIFVGSPDDIVPLSFGKDLPDMRDWVPQHFDFAGYIIGEHPKTFGSRADLRERLGYRPDQRVCIVTVGGSAVGAHLIRRILQSYPMARARLPELRMIVVAGPRIDPASLNAPEGVEVRAFVPNLDRHLAACDLALVQGGLTTCMELTAARNAVPLFPAQEPLRAEFPRRASPRPLRRRKAYGVRHCDAGSDRRGDGRCIARTGQIETRRSRRCRPRRAHAGGSDLTEINFHGGVSKMSSTNNATQIDEGKLNAFVGQMLTDLGGASSIAMVRMGDALGLYKALHTKGPMTTAELANTAKVDPRYLREWLSHQASSNYLAYDPASEKFTMTPEQAMVFAIPESPVYLMGGFDLMAALLENQPKVQSAFKSGGGVAWGNQAGCMFCAVARFFRPGYHNHLVSAWLPALGGNVLKKLEAGAKVADVGCGHGWSTVMMAKAFPKSQFIGYDFHPGSIEDAKAHAETHGVTANTRFEVGLAKDYPGKDFDLVTCFDCLHDMGDPAGAAAHIRQSLKKDGTWMICEPMAGDRLEQNLNPVGRLYYAGSTMICVPTSLSQEVGTALGAQAGEAKLRDVILKGGFTSVRRATETPFNMILEARP